MFFRGRQPEASIWRRFRASADGFAFTQEEGHYMAHVVANAERVVQLFHALSEQFPPEVDVALDDLRTGQSWKGEGVALPGVRQATANLESLLAEYGGVELSVFTPEDQLTLSPDLELFVYARTDRWLYLLQGLGLEEQKAVHARSWKAPDQPFPAAPDLVSAIRGAVDRLGLIPG